MFKFDFFQLHNQCSIFSILSNNKANYQLSLSLSTKFGINPARRKFFFAAYTNEGEDGDNFLKKISCRN